MPLTLNTILLWSAGAYCALGLFNMLQAPRQRDWSWVAVYVAILLVGAAGLAFFPASAGFVAASLATLFGLVPSACASRQQRYLQEGRYPEALRMAQVVAWLHPFGGWRRAPEYVRALADQARGDLAAARARLQRLELAGAPRELNARLLAMRVDGNYRGFVQWVQGEYGEAAALDQPAVAASYLRALGETGDVSGLLRAFETVAPRLPRPDWQPVAGRCCLFAAAYTGQVDETAAVLARDPAASIDAARFWMATARWVAGDRESALADFHALAASAEPAVRPAAAGRLAWTPPGRRAPETPGWEPRLREAISRVQPTASAPPPPPGPRPWATYGLVAVNLLAYGWELSKGNPENPRILIQAGALVPTAFRAQEAWRLVTALFLHAGLLHLAMNMLALTMFGGRLEAAMGVVRYVGIYLLSGVLGSLFVVATFSNSFGSLAVFAGASGCIMGVIGATTALAVLAWRRTGAARPDRQLTALGLMLLVQFGFDLTHPQVSFSAHAAGFVIGFLLTLVLERNRRAPVAVLR